MEQNKNQLEQNPIDEIKKQISKKINEIGYQEYRLNQQEKLKQFVEQFGWETVDGDKMLDKAEEKDEQ